MPSIVLVACPQANPLRAWMSNDIFPDHLKSPSSRKSSQRNWDKRDLDTAKAVMQTAEFPVAQILQGSFSWIPAVAGISDRVKNARILIYDHGDVADDRGLKSLAENLLRVVHNERKNSEKSPIFFVCHSIGGLVVKVALTEASRNSTYRSLLQNCHGVTFFATPHRGSKYLAAKDYRPSIQRLLELKEPLPSTLMGEMLLDHGDSGLLRIDSNFRELASEIRIWSFYEALDSKLSAKTITGLKEIHFAAPITAMRSALLGLRHEKIFGLQATHASCASFGRHNTETLRLFLEDFCEAVSKADKLNQNAAEHAPLKLEQQREVVEVHGFYESVTSATVPTESEIHIFTTKRSLSSFCDEGPEQLLQKRLDVSARTDLPRAKSLTPSRPPLPKTPLPKSPSKTTSGLRVDDKRTGGNVRNSSERRSSRLSVPSSMAGASSQQTMAADRPALTKSYSNPNLPRALPSLVTGSHVSEPKGVLVESTVKSTLYAEPNKEIPKFTWIHVPSNNPPWVQKVFGTLALHLRRDFSDLFNAEHWISRHKRGRHSQHHACFIKSACALTPLKSKPSKSDPTTVTHTGQHQVEDDATLGPIQQNPRSSLQGCLYLYFPFLHFDSYKMLIRRRDMIRKRVQQGRTCPIPREVQEDPSFELKMIWEFLGHDPPINCRRTLDQYRYPSLHDTRARDDDQMLYKMTKQSIYKEAERKDASSNQQNKTREAMREDNDYSEAEFEDMEEHDSDDEHRSQTEYGYDVGENEVVQDVLDGNVLMVDQLWLWSIDASKYDCLYWNNSEDV